MDANRMTCVYFIITSMNLLKSESCSFDKQHVKEWVYTQMLPDGSGFIGGPYIDKNTPAALNHLASTYTALALLI